MLKFIIVAVALVVTPVFADDSGGSSDSDRVDVRALLEDARYNIKNEKFKRAIYILNEVVREEYNNADAWNLLGYSHRNLGRYKKAGKAYRKALKFDPKHKGALEYQGELFIKLGRVEDARANRERLAALCPQGCEQLQDLDSSLSSIN